MNLDKYVTCCRLLLSKVDSEASKSRRCTDGSLLFSNKAVSIFGKRGIEEVASLIQC